MSADAATCTAAVISELDGVVMLKKNINTGLTVLSEDIFVSLYSGLAW